MEFSKQEGMTMERSVEAVMTWVSEEYKIDIVTEENPLQNTTDTVSEENPLQNPTDTVAEESPSQNPTNTVAEENPLQNTNDQDIKQDCNHDELLERLEHLEQINLELIKLLKEKAVREAYQEQKINQILKYVERTAQLASERSKMEEARMQIASANQKKWWKW